MAEFPAHICTKFPVTSLPKITNKKKRGRSNKNSASTYWSEEGIIDGRGIDALGEMSNVLSGL